MQAILFIGIPATGKSSFYRARFWNTHVRISLDLLRTRHRERVFLDACLSTEQRFVVDNTNPAAADRARYVSAATRRGYSIVGYYFESRIADALRRNRARTGVACIPDVGVLDAYRRLEPPTYSEGFDQLSFVRLRGERFEVEEWRDEV